jgi:hypothetical protein
VSKQSGAAFPVKSTDNDNPSTTLPMAEVLPMPPVPAPVPAGHRAHVEKMRNAYNQRGLAARHEELKAGRCRFNG